MTVKRNVEGLAVAAQKKRQESFDKVEQGIQQLLKERKVINFNTVAQISGVSKAWLYKEPEIKARIEHLRQNNLKTQKIPPKEKLQDASKDTIIKTLKERIKKVETENRELREQNEVIYGRMLQISELEQRLERLELENTKLKNQLEACQSQLSKPLLPEKSILKSVPIKKVLLEISDTIKDELDALNIKLTNTLTSKMRQSTEDIVLTAIEALKEQLQYQVIRNPGGWLANAIDNQWQPNQPQGCETHASDIFTQWYDLAREQGIVIGSRKDDDGSIWVRENAGHWVPFEDFSSKWTIEYLRSKK